MSSPEKESLAILRSLLETVQDAAAMPEGVDIELSNAFHTEVLFFLLYLASADGKITANERDYINHLLDLNHSIKDLVNLINEHNIYSTEFEERIPVTMQIVAAFDEKVRQVRNDAEPLVQTMIKYFEKIGEKFVYCDKDVNQQEISDYRLYLSNLKNHFPAITGGISVSDEVGYIGKKKGADGLPVADTSKRSGRNRCRYSPAKYKVGVDMPAGEYKLFCTDSEAYYCISADVNDDDIIRNGSFSGQAYIDVCKGQYVSFQECYALPVLEAPLFDSSRGIYGPGEYKVGLEIPAGEYRITSLSDNGYYSLELHSGNGERDIIRNDYFENATYVEISNGQILTLHDCKIVL